MDMDKLELKSVRHPNCDCDKPGSEAEQLKSLKAMRMAMELVQTVDVSMVVHDMCRRDGILVLVCAAGAFSARSFPSLEEARREVQAAVDFYFEQLEVTRKQDEKLGEALASIFGAH